MSGTAIELHGRLVGIEVATNRVYQLNRPFNVTMTAAAGTTNQTIVTIQIVDFEGNKVSGVFNTDVWLSDAATGAGLTATTASGTVGNSGTAGADLGTYTSKKAIYVQTSAAGAYTLAITDTAKTAFKVCCLNPADGQALVGITLATANYG